MNWNWDELEEKKNKQAPPQNQAPNRAPWGDVTPDFNRLKSSLKPILWVLGLILVLGWLATGFYIVQPDELGVATRFGKYVETTEPGPHYFWPYPIGRLYKPKVTEVKRIEVSRTSRADDDVEMLTKDENLVNVQFSVQYQISDPVQYLFKVANHTALISNAAQAVMREVIADNSIDAALTDGKLEIQTKAQALLQELVQKYALGVNIIAVQLQNVFPPQQVSDAFKAVASAREDKIRFINEAETYRNDVLPKARGEAAAIINEAQAYKTAKLLTAQADTAKFSLLLTEFKKAPQVTKQRLYIEAIEGILRNTKSTKFIVPEDVSKSILPLPYLPFPQKNEEKTPQQSQ